MRDRRTTQHHSFCNNSFFYDIHYRSFYLLGQFDQETEFFSDCRITMYVFELRCGKKRNREGPNPISTWTPNSQAAACYTQITDLQVLHMYTLTLQALYSRVFICALLTKSTARLRWLGWTLQSLLRTLSVEHVQINSEIKL
jgi:hypothetical protein